MTSDAAKRLEAGGMTLSCNRFSASAPNICGVRIRRRRTAAHGALPPGPLLSSGGGHKWQISATTRDTAMTPVNASILIETKRVIPLMVPEFPSPFVAPAMQKMLGRPPRRTATAHAITPFHCPISAQSRCRNSCGWPLSRLALVTRCLTVLNKPKQGELQK